MSRSNSSKFIFIFDLIVIYVSFASVYFFYRGSASIPFGASLFMGFVGFFWFFIAINSRILNLSTQSGPMDVALNTIVAYSVLSAGSIAFVAIFGNYRHNDRLVLYPLLFSVIASTGIRLVLILTIRHFARSGYEQRSVLLIGGGRIALAVLKQIADFPELGFRIHGVLADNDHESLPGGYHLGGLARFSEIIRSNLVDEVLIALPYSYEETIIRLVENCENEGLRVRVVPDFFRICKNRVVLDELGNIPLIAIRSEPLSMLRNRIVKRVFDIVFSLAVLILSSPLFLFLVVTIKLSSRGPVIFSQRRVGINSKEFTMHKFRSMVVQRREESDVIWTTPDDGRVTQIGRFMRKTNLDELPQFWNVLKGEMSVVGPRPERQYFVGKFKEEIRNYKVRHLVKSGITGLAQVNGWRGDTSIKKRVEFDIYYLENWSFSLDLKIIWLTIFGGKARRNAY